MSPNLRKKKYFPKINFDLKPDPAFGMKPNDTDLVDNIIHKLGLKDFLDNKILMLTVAEPAPITRHSFKSQVGSGNKINSHRKFLAGLLKRIIQKTDYNILFP